MSDSLQENVVRVKVVFIPRSEAPSQYLVNSKRLNQMEHSDVITRGGRQMVLCYATDIGKTNYIVGNSSLSRWVKPGHVVTGYAYLVAVQPALQYDDELKFTSYDFEDFKQDWPELVANWDTLRFRVYDAKAVKGDLSGCKLMTQSEQVSE